MPPDPCLALYRLALANALLLPLALASVPHAVSLTVLRSLAVRSAAS